MQWVLAEPREDADPDEVAQTLLLDHGVKVRHGVDVLDLDDLETGETVPLDLTDGGEVRWSYRPADRVTGEDNSTSTVRRQATLTFTGDVTVPLMARRFRPWTEMLSPLGNWLRFWLGVFVATSATTVEDDGVLIRRRLSLADKSWTWANWPLDEPLVVDAGENPVQWVIDDLGTRFGETSTAITSTTVTLTEAMVFNPTETPSILDVYNALLQAAAFDQLTVNEAGRPTTLPLADLAGRAPEVTYGPGKRKIVVAGSVEPLLPNLPNVVRFVARQGPSLAEEGNGIRTVKNQSTGATSIDEIGELPPLVVEVDVEDQAELDTIAYADAQRYFAGGGNRFTGQVGLNPLHSNRDVIGLDKPRLGLSGTWLVTEWAYPLRHFTSPDAALMSITCEQRVDVTEA